MGQREIIRSFCLIRRFEQVTPAVAAGVLLKLWIPER
jgi:hypothetical protein